MTHLIAFLSLVTLTLHAPNAINDGPPQPNTCTAVIVAPTLALTAGHCIEQAVVIAPIIAEDSNGRKSIATVKAYDPDSDLALLTLSRKYQIFARIGAPPKQGDKLETYNSGEDFNGTYNEGIMCTMADDELLHFKVIVTNIVILPGASGGGMFSTDGKLVGINRWAYKNGLSGAINTHIVAEFLKKNGISQ